MRRQKQQQQQQQEEKQQQQKTLPSFRRSPQPTQRAAEDNCVLLRGLLHLFWHNLNASSVVILSKIEIVFACFTTHLPAAFPWQDKSECSMQFSLLQACCLLPPTPQSCPVAFGAALCYFTFALKREFIFNLFSSTGCALIPPAPPSRCKHAAISRQNICRS